MANTEEQSGIKTLSQLFDEVYADFKKLVDHVDLNSPSSQASRIILHIH